MSQIKIEEERINKLDLKSYKIDNYQKDLFETIYKLLDEPQVDKKHKDFVLNSITTNKSILDLFSV